MGEHPQSENVSGSESRRLWIVAVGGGVVIAQVLGLRDAVDMDFWLHLRIGDELRKGTYFGALPDPLVALADRPYVPTQWLAEVTQSMIYEQFGLQGIHVLRVVGIATLVFVTYLCSRYFANPFLAAVTALITVLATSGAWGERPQLAALVLAASVVLIWTRALSREAVPWLIVPLLWLWACLHGSWILGIGTGVVFSSAALAQRPFSRYFAQRLLVLNALSCLVVALTPLGPGLWMSPFQVASAARGSIEEWRRPSWGNPLLILVLVMVVVALIHVVRHRTSLILLLLPIAAAAMALSAVRTIAFGALLAGPAFAAALAEADGREPISRPRPEGYRWIALSVVLILAGPLVLDPPKAAPLEGPIALSLARIPPGSRVAVDPHLSGWILHEYPSLVPLSDVRVEVYSKRVAAGYVSFMLARKGWQQYAAYHGVRAIVVEGGSELDTALKGTHEWELVAAEEDYRMWRFRSTLG